MLTLRIGRFISGRANIVQRRMATLPIVKRFDVKENVSESLRTERPLGFLSSKMLKPTGWGWWM